MHPKSGHPRGTVAALLGLLIAHAGLLAWSAWRHSPTVDEVEHLVAGVSHVELARFDLYRVNPPLVRTVAALPVALARPADAATCSTATSPGGRTSSSSNAGWRIILRLDPCTWPLSTAP